VGGSKKGQTAGDKNHRFTLELGVEGQRLVEPWTFIAIWDEETNNDREGEIRRHISSRKKKKEGGKRDKARGSSTPQRGAL